MDDPVYGCQTYQPGITININNQSVFPSRQHSDDNPYAGHRCECPCYCIDGISCLTHNLTIGTMFGRGAVTLSELLVLGITVSKTYKIIRESRRLSMFTRNTLSYVMFCDGEHMYNVISWH